MGLDVVKKEFAALEGKIRSAFLAEIDEFSEKERKRATDEAFGSIFSALLKMQDIEFDPKKAGEYIAMTKLVGIYQNKTNAGYPWTQERVKDIAEKHGITDKEIVLCLFVASQGSLIIEAILAMKEDIYEHVTGACL